MTPGFSSHVMLDACAFRSFTSTKQTYGLTSEMCKSGVPAQEPLQTLRLAELCSCGPALSDMERTLVVRASAMSSVAGPSSVRPSLRRSSTRRVSSSSRQLRRRQLVEADRTKNHATQLKRATTLNSSASPEPGDTVDSNDLADTASIRAILNDFNRDRNTSRA